jgi:hypothetical protein
MKKGNLRCWSSANTVLGSWKMRTGLEMERMLILNEAWEREVGNFSQQWVLDGVRRGVVYVRVKTPAAAQELQMRGRQIVRGLNKYFKRSWIRAIRTAGPRGI